MATLKQIKAAEKIVENHGNLAKTMREVGYEENTIKNPKNLTNSKGWKELVKHIPDHLLLKTQLEGLKATNNADKPDYAVRHKYLETGLKVKRYLTPETDDRTQPLTINLIKISQDGLDRLQVSPTKLPEGNT